MGWSLGMSSTRVSPSDRRTPFIASSIRAQSSSRRSETARITSFVNLSRFEGASMRTYVPLVGAVSILAVSSAFAQTTDPALTAAIAARDKAAIARNADEVAKYTADDYFSVNPTGQLMNKKQRIDGLRTPAAAGAAPQVPIRTEFVRMYGPSVAVARMRATNNRQIFVWVKNPQGWQVEVIHIVPDAFPTTPAAAPVPAKTAQPTPV